MLNADKLRAVMAAVAGFMILAGGQAGAGLIVLSGDENITNALTGNGTPVNPGNRTFFAKVLGAGTRVLVQGTDVGGVDTPVANTNTFFNSLSGVTSTIQSGLVTSANLAGVDLFISAIPSVAFTSSEILAISNFSAAGGTLFLLGDASGFAAARDANLNLLLTGIGSSLRIVPDSIDVGFRFAGSSHIAADPLTAGVSSFTYTYVAAVSGGTSLFTASGGQTFVAATGEIRVVPEPSTVVLLASALGRLAAFTARRNVRGRRVSLRTRDCA